MIVMVVDNQVLALGRVGIETVNVFCGLCELLSGIVISVICI